MRDRTADLLRARQALSQLSYNPIQSTVYLYTLPLIEEFNSFSDNAESCEVCYCKRCVTTTQYE